LLKKYPVGRLRNIALVGHGGSGKTALAEALLYDAGTIDRLGANMMDYDPDEQKAGYSINTSIAYAEWKDCKVNILDTPGTLDFVGEVKAALRVADAAIIVMDSVSGVEVGTGLTWGYAAQDNVPRMIFVNKMDRENADFGKTLAAAVEAFGNTIAPIQMPIGAEAKFRGVIDLVHMKAYAFDGRKVSETEIPADLKDQAEQYRAQLAEAAAGDDDELIMKFLDTGELTPEEIGTGLAKGFRTGKLVPVCCGSAARNIGMQALLDVLVDHAPSPADHAVVSGTNPKTDAADQRQASESAPLSALVFKTMADPDRGKMTVLRVYSGIMQSDSRAYNANRSREERIGQLYAIKGKLQEPVDSVSAGDIVAVAKLAETTTGDTLCDESAQITYAPPTFPKPIYHVAVMPKTRTDEDKIGSALARIMEEDPTVDSHKDPATLQNILSGMGDKHLDIVTQRLERKFGVNITLEMPKIAYKETIRTRVEAEHKHKKQSGGRGQYGHVKIEMEPMPDGEFEFLDKTFGGSVPKNFIPAVEKGMREAIVKGVLAGFPVTHMRIALLDGSYHAVDSSEMAFKIASHQAFKKGMAAARPVILEPIYAVEVRIPQEFMGDVISDMNKKRGKVLGMDADGNYQLVKAMVPLSEMAKYAIDLRSIAQGYGTFTMTPDHYEEVPGNVAELIIKEAAKDKKDEEDEE
jgi:elongation factor G